MDIFHARTWAAKEARNVLERIEGRANDVPIVLKTAYGPSGKPHLGTACEIIRTSMVAKVLREIQPRPVVVISFADNMDGLRKVADDMPNRDMLLKHIGFPLCNIPDPFTLASASSSSLLGDSSVNIHESFAEYAISSVAGFLDLLGYKSVEYRPKDEYSTKKMAEISPNGEIIILRSSDMYKNSLFDKVMLEILQKHKEILDVMLPDLGPERRATYSPLMPISPKSGRVLERGVKEYKKTSIVFEEDGETFETEVNGNNYKAQWKVDFAMQWICLQVDYEMAGKDISIGSTPLSSRICRILGGTPPPGMMYEMFLASDGSKMSKTKGNGVSIEDWFNYSTPETVRHFMFLNPMTAKKVDVLKMPAYIDAYIKDLEKFIESPDVENPIWYSEPGATIPINTEEISNNPEKLENNSEVDIREDEDKNRQYTAAQLNISPAPNIIAGLALSLLQGLHPDSVEVFVEFLRKRIPSFNEMDQKIAGVMFRFYNEQFSPPELKAAPEWVKKYLARFEPSGDSKEMQSRLYDLGNEAVAAGDVKMLKDWFRQLYQVFFGYECGPRLGSFFELYGIDNSRKMLARILDAS